MLEELKMSQSMINFLAGRMRKIYNIDELRKGHVTKTAIKKMVKSSNFPTDVFNYKDFSFNSKKHSLTIEQVREFMYHLLEACRVSDNKKMEFERKQNNRRFFPTALHKDYKTPIEVSDNYFLKKHIGDFPKQDRRLNWDTEKPVAEKFTGFRERTYSYVREYSKSYMSKFGPHTVVNHYFVYSSYVLHNESIAVYKLNGKLLKKIKAPRGYAFGKDNYGFKIYRIKAPDIDYHPSANELLKGKRYLTQCIRDLETKRKQARLEQKIIQKTQKLDIKKDVKKLKNFYVLTEDAKRAGNCDIGIKSFKEQHELKNVKYVRANKVRELALRYENKDKILYNRIVDTIKKAYERHNFEMSRKKCNLHF